MRYPRAVRGYLYGAFIVALVLIPNSMSDRLSIFACALIPLGVGLGLRRYARRQASPSAN